MAIEAPAFEDTMEAQAPLTPPLFDETSDAAPLSPPSFEETSELESPIQGSNLSSVGLASASRGILQGVTGAIRAASTIYPQFRGLADTIAESTGIPTTEEFMTELEGASSRASDDYGVDPKQKGLLVDLASGAGTLLPTIASGPFAPFTTAAMMGEQGLQESREAGASPTQQATAFLGNAATGFVTEKLLGLPALLKSARAAKLPEKTLRALIGSVTKQVGLSFLREGTQESLEQFSQDVIAKYISAYDKKRNEFDGKKLAKTFLVGGLLGGPVGGVVQLATDLDSSKEQNQIEAEQVDQTIAQAATIQPPPLPTGYTQQGTPILSPEDIQNIPRGTPEELQSIANAVQERPTETVLRNVPQQPEGQPVQVPTQESAERVPQGTEVQPEVSAETGFIGTAIRTPTGSVSGETPGSAHLELVDQALSEGSEVNESDLGFAFRRPDGTTEWVDRVEAGKRLTESGQITGLKPGERLTSEHIRGEVPGVTFTATPSSEQTQPLTTGTEPVTATLAAEVPLGMMRKSAIDERLETLSDEDFRVLRKRVRKELDDVEKRMDEVGAPSARPERLKIAEAQDRFSAVENENFRRSTRFLSPADMWERMRKEISQLPNDPSAGELDSQSATRLRLLFRSMQDQGYTQEMLIKDMAELSARQSSDPDFQRVQKHDFEKAQRYLAAFQGGQRQPVQLALGVSSNQAAETLQLFFNEAVEAARKSGASDPEAAASQAQIELSNQVEQGRTTLDNPKSLFMGAARRQAGKQKVIEQTTEPEPVTTRGPRAEAISDEDTRSIDTAINRLPETQKNIIQKLTEDPTLTDQDLSDELGLTIDQVKKGKSAARKTLQSFIQEQGIGLSMGPGAASAAEVLVRYEERKFGKRFQETEEIAPEIKRDTGDRYYEPIPNQVTAQKATELIDANGEEAIESEIRDDKSTLSYADRSTVGQILIKRYNERYKSLKESNPEEAKRVLDKAADLAEWAADFGTKLGQGVQSFAMWSRLTPEGKLRTFERMVDKKRKDYIRHNRSDIDEIKDIVNADEPAPKKVEKIRKLKSKTAKKIKTRAGKIIQAAKDGKLTDKKFFEASGDALGLPVFSPEVAAEILRMANDIDAAPEGMPKMEATLKLNKFLAQQKGFDPSDLLFGVYYGNILSGLQTQGVNLLDTTLNVINESVNLAIRNPAKSIPILRGLAKGFTTGRSDAITSLLSGRRISDGKFVEDPFLMEVADFGKKGGVPIKTNTAAGRAAKRFSESVLGTPLKLYKYIGRAMAASDAFAFRGAQEAKAAQLAYQIANEQGQNTTEYVNRILGYDRIPEFQKQAESEGYKGNQAKARATELMIMSRPPEIQKAATDFAAESTYNVKPYGIMGAVSNSIEGLSRNVKPLKLVVPFTRIVANVMNRGLNNSPYGYVSAIRGKTFGGKHAREFTTEERNAMLVRATISTTLVAALVALHEAGALTIHGQGPSDPEKKKQLRQSGWKPYTIQIGNTYLNYNLTPWGLVMAATGNWLDNEKYQDFSSKEGLDKMTYSLQSVASTMFNQSFLSGLSTVFDAIAGKSPAQQISAGKRFTANTVSSLGVPFNSALKDIEAIFSEPNIPRVDSMRQAMIASIPFASQGLQPQLNALGEPVKSSRSRFLNFQNDDPVWKLVYQKGLRVPVPNTFFDAPDDQYEYVKQQGQALRKWMEANLNRLNGMSTEDAQHAIENASNTFRERERNKLIFEGRKRKEKKR